MRALIAALALTLAVAVTASVFAIWPVVADAPWEDDVPVAESSDALRCQGALDYRTAIASNPPTHRVTEDRKITISPPTLPDPREGVVVTDQDALQRLLDQAEREIDYYC